MASASSASSSVSRAAVRDALAKLAAASEEVLLSEAIWFQPQHRLARASLLLVEVALPRSPVCSDSEVEQGDDGPPALAGPKAADGSQSVPVGAPGSAQVPTPGSQSVPVSASAMDAPAPGLKLLPGKTGPPPTKAGMSKPSGPDGPNAAPPPKKAGSQPTTSTSPPAAPQVPVKNPTVVKPLTLKGAPPMKYPPAVPSATSVVVSADQPAASPAHCSGTSANVRIGSAEDAVAALGVGSCMTPVVQPSAHISRPSSSGTARMGGGGGPPSTPTPASTTSPSATADKGSTPGQAGNSVAVCSATVTSSSLRF